MQAANSVYLLVCTVCAVYVCCRKKHRGAHGFIQDTELPDIPGIDGQEAATKDGYYSINASTLDRGNHYDSFNQENIYAEIPADDAANCEDPDTAKAMKTSPVPEGEEKDGPIDVYDSAELPDGVTANGKEEAPIENYECMTGTTDAVNNTTAM